MNPPKLRYNLTLDGCKVSFQVLEQDEELRNKDGGEAWILFTASNGVRISSWERVGLSIERAKSIQIRGVKNKEDLEVYSFNLDSEEAARAYCDKADKVLKEFVAAKVLYEIKEEEDHATFQVLWQEEGLRRVGDEQRHIFFCKNGWRISLSGNPWIQAVDSLPKAIFIRGDDGVSDNSIVKFDRQFIPAVREALAEFNGQPVKDDRADLERAIAAMEAKDISEEQFWANRESQLSTASLAARQAHLKLREANPEEALRQSRSAFWACMWDLKGRK